MKFSGTHILGRSRARTLGFPTINLHNINTVIMEDGVYAARATVNGTTFKTAMFVGESPTFKDKEKSVELYLIGLVEGDVKKYQLSPLVTTKIFVETVQFVRPVIKFNSRKELIDHIKADVQQVDNILNTQPAII
ncbi:MAG: riboflavin kinase [Candidatus Roizmanbacteria bacterium]|nr:riboflavin kinase [Candidatus Roizmanbacteria bacterium]